MGRHAPRARRARRRGRGRAGGGTRRRPADRPAGRGAAGPRRSARARPVGLELERGQAGPRAPVLVRAGHLGRAQRAVRTAVRRAGAGLPPGGARRAAADGGRVLPRADPHRRPGPRHRHRAVPARLLPPVPPGRPPGDRRAGRGGRAGAGGDRRVEPPGVPAPGRATAPPGARPRAAQPVRLADLAARPHREAVRDGLPAGDLRAGPPAGPRLLRAAVPARRRAGGAGRPQVRPIGERRRRACCGSTPPTPSPMRRPTPRASWRRSCATSPGGSGWPRSGSPGPATSLPGWPAR